MTGSRPSSEYYDHEDGIDRCPACRHPRFERRHRIERFGFPFEFYRCACGLMKQIPMPNESFFAWFFNSEIFFSSNESQADEIWGFYDYFKDESGRLKTSIRRLRIFSKILNWVAPREIMKIGPSTGTFLHVAQQAGHRVRGCDISDRFARYAKDSYGVEIDIGRYEQLDYESQRFDDLLLLNVIENVPNLEEFLSAIQRTVKIGGNLILNHVEMSGNALAKLQGSNYFLFRPPVCYCFEGPALRALLSRYGFEIQFQLRDIRYMHIEKMATLLRWRRVLQVARLIGIDRIDIPIWAYPSWISIARRVR